MDRREAQTKVVVVVNDEGHDVDVDRVDRVGWWCDVDPARPVGGEGEALPRREVTGGWERSDL